MLRIWLSVLLVLALASPALAEQLLQESRIHAQVQGAVKRPGVYVVPAGSRLAELIAKAGGPRKDAHLKSVNLAKRVADGESVYVPTHKEAAPPPPPTAQAPRRARTTRRAARPAPAQAQRLGPLNLNTATPAQLETLPGVGPGLAAAIVKARARKGRFHTLEDLREIAGIGKKRFERLRPHVAVY